MTNSMRTVSQVITEIYFCKFAFLNVVVFVYLMSAHDLCYVVSSTASRKRKLQKSLSATKKRARKDNSGTIRSADVNNAVDDGCGKY